MTLDEISFSLRQVIAICALAFSTGLTLGVMLGLGEPRRKR